LRLDTANTYWQRRRDGLSDGFDERSLKPWESQPSPADLDTTALQSELWLAQKARQAVKQGKGDNNKWVGRWTAHQIEATDRDLRAIGNVLDNPHELRAAAEAHGINPMFTDYKDQVMAYEADLHMQALELFDRVVSLERRQESFNNPVTPSGMMGSPESQRNV
jgi:hypothetical protein